MWCWTGAKSPEARLWLRAPWPETVWPLLANKVLPATDVRAAAAVVSKIPNLIGIIYKTDAIVSDELKILYEIDLSSAEQLERVKYVAAGVTK